MGESSDWSAQPAFDIKRALHPGDNIIAVGVANGAGGGGLNSDVNVELVGKASVNLWSRSVFNGLAQVLVQADKQPGTLTLTARSPGLESGTLNITAGAAIPRPAVP